MRAIIGSIGCCALIFFCALSAESIPVVSRSASEEKPVLALEFSIPTKKNGRPCVVGEMVPFTVRCTYNVQHYSVTSLVVPTHQNVIFFIEQQPKKQQIIVKGAACGVQEWHGYAYATKAGTFEWGPCVVHGEQSSTHTSRNFFRMLVNSAYSVYSNTALVTIEPLPPSPLIKNLTGVIPVGDFYAAHLECEKLTIKTGEAQTIRYTVEGAGNVELLNHPVLEMPSQIKWYPGEKKADGNNRVVFEYVIQALEQGNVTITAQHFVYFCTERHAYKTLATAPLRLHITQGVIIPQVSEDIESPLVITENSAAEPPEQNPCIPSYTGPFELPKKIFMATLFAFSMVILYLFISVPLKRSVWWFQKYLRYRSLLRAARLGHRQYILKGDVTMLYENFKGLRALKEMEGAAWDTFWNNLECRRFDIYKVDERKSNETVFIEETERWLYMFESELWHIT